MGAGRLESSRVAGSRDGGIQSRKGGRLKHNNTMLGLLQGTSFVEVVGNNIHEGNARILVELRTQAAAA